MPDSRRPLPAPLRVLLGTQLGPFYAGNGLSLIGTWMQRTACGWLVWDWTHSVLWLGILSAGDLLPGMLVGPFAGVAADRWNRLRQNMLAQIASAVLAALTAILLASGHLGLVAVILLITAQGTLTAAIQPARMAMVQQIVPRADMHTAVALNSVIVNLTRMIGPALAGAMIVRSGVVWIFAVNAAVTLAFVFILAALDVAPHARSPGGRSFMGEMADGFVHILRDRALWLILLVMLCGGAIVRAMMELVPAIAAGTFRENATGLAILTSAAAFGAVASGLAMGRVRAANMLYGVFLWWGLGALAAIALTQARGPVLAVASAIVLGAAITRGLVSTQTFVQLTTPDALRGRVLGVHGIIARGSPALGALVIGLAADRIGLARAVEVSSGALLVSLLALVPHARHAATKIDEAASRSF